VLTSFPPQPSAAAPCNTLNRSTALALPNTNLIAHILTEKTCTTNHNKICPKAVQEDIIDGSVSSTPEPYRAHRASHSEFHRAHINSTLIWLSQESNRVAPLNIFHASIAFFHTSSSYQAYLLFYELYQEILHDPQTSFSCTFLYAVDRKIQCEKS
jgi:hypothetical protein